MKNKLILFLLLFIIFFSLPAFSSTFNLPLAQNSWNEAKINSVIDSIYSLNGDPIYGGFFLEMNEDGSVYNNEKISGDYYSLIDLYLTMSKEFGNESYISLAESILPFLLKFYRFPRGYVDILSPDWSDKSETAFYSSSSFLMMDTYLSLFEYTNNQSYLNEALRIRDFINSYFLDVEHWGFHDKIFANTKSPDYGYWRVPGYYGLYYNTLFHLFSLTKNETFLLESLEGLNNTIHIAYDFDNGFLYAYMNGQNSQWVSEFQIHQQIDFLVPLLQFINLNHSMVIPYRSFFQEIFDKTTNKLFSYGINNDNIVIHTFDPEGKITDSIGYITRQIMVAMLLELMEEYDMLLSLYQKDFLASASNTYSLFFNPEVNAFFRSPDYQKFHPWVNWVVLKGIIQTNLLETSENSTTSLKDATNLPLITTTNSFQFELLFLSMIFLTVFSRNRRKLLK